MTAPVLLIFAALLLALAGAVEISGRAIRSGAVELRLPRSLAPLVARLDLASRIARAGLGERLTVPGLVAAKAAGTLAGMLLAPIAAPVAPGRLALVIALGLPVAGFLAPDALLERRARARARALRGSLPDALDLLATAAAAGRSPLTGFAEISRGQGALARELAMVVAETSCGAPQRDAFEALRRRVPAQELAAMCSAIERSRRHGSPLADQLHDQAGSLRGSQRRRISEQAARAAPKIQLAVALLLVPSVLLMIAAGLLANADRFLAGI
jgi:tight adherence protein C